MNNPRLKGIVERFAKNKKMIGDFPTFYQIFCNYLILKQKYYDINWEFPYESYLDYELLKNIETAKLSQDFLIYLTRNHIHFYLPNLSRAHHRYINKNLEIFFAVPVIFQSEKHPHI